MCMLLLLIATGIWDADQWELVKLVLVVPDRNRKQTIPFGVGVAVVIRAAVVK